MKNVILIGALLASTQIFAQQQINIGYNYGVGTENLNASSGGFIEIDNVGLQYDNVGFVENDIFTLNIDEFELNTVTGGTIDRYGLYFKIPLNTTYAPFEFKLGVGSERLEKITLNGTKKEASIYLQAGANIYVDENFFFTSSYLFSSENLNTFMLGVGFRIF